jgi:transposase
VARGALLIPGLNTWPGPGKIVGFAGVLVDVLQFNNHVRLPKGADIVGIPNLSDPVTSAIMMPQNDTLALFFASLYDLEAPLYISKVIKDKEAFTIDIFVAYHARSVFTSPNGEKNLKVHSTQPRAWRGLDIDSYALTIHMDVPRVKLPSTGKVVCIDVPWARKYSSLTTHFEQKALALATTESKASAAKHLGISAERLGRIVNHHVEEAKADEDCSEVTCAAVDETQMAKGHIYISVFSIPKEQRLLFATPGKDSDTVRGFACFLTEHRGDPENITEISSDMSPAFMKGIAEHLPNANVTLDKFHVIKEANAATDSIRRRESKDEPSLKGSRWLWISNPSDLSPANAARFLPLSKRKLKTAVAYRYRLTLQDIYNSKTPEEAEPLFKRLIRWGKRTQIPELVTLANTIEKNLTGILRHFTSGLTNGYAEGLNTKIQEIKRRSRGFPNPRNFINMLYLCLGKLPILKRYGTGPARYDR